MTTLTANKNNVIPLRKAKAKSQPVPTGYDLSFVPAEHDALKQVLGAFLNSGAAKERIGKYFIDGNGLYFRTADTRLHTATLREEIIALKIKQGSNTLVLGNSSVLPWVDAPNAKTGKMNRGQTTVQRYLSQVIPMLPFTVFQQAKLNVNKLQIVERGAEESVKVRLANPKYKTKYNVTTGESESNGEPEFIRQPRHFTGASLFRIGRDYFLFDIDRREIEHGIFNAFLVALPKPAKSIKEAYEILKPAEVKAAEAKGLQVLRQGEFFFIPVPDAKCHELNNIRRDSAKEEVDVRESTDLDRITLQAGVNRPNYAHGIEIKDGARLMRREMTWDDRRNAKADAVYLTGLVEHAGREHEALDLKSWYTVVPNTASRSFTLTGDVD